MKSTYLSPTIDTKFAILLPIIILAFPLFLFAQNERPFITVWQTDKLGASGNNQIIIPGIGTNYIIEWEEVGNPGNNGSETGTDRHTITFPSPGIYRVSISGGFSRIHFGRPGWVAGDERKILDVTQWGDIAWSTMEDAFWDARHLDITATDAPDLSGVTSLANMFRGNHLMNGSIGHWDTGNVTDMSNMFNGATAFNQDIGGWDVSNVANMTGMFEGTRAYNQDIGSWNVSSVTNMSGMFGSTSAFNQDIGGWDVSSVTTMSSMFFRASSFNQNIGGWDVSNVTIMGGMFNYGTSFNGDISSWITSNVTNMSGMFQHATSFNQDIGGWDVSSVVNMSRMFSNASSFNQDIGEWNTGNVIYLDAMFRGATSFNRDIGRWNLRQVRNMFGMLDETALSTVSYDNTLFGWSSQILQTGVGLGAKGLFFCNAGYARQHIIDTFDWTIRDEGLRCPIEEMLAIYPNTGGDIGVISVNIFGNGFDYGLNVKLISAGYADIVGDVVTIDDNGMRMRVRFDLTGKAHGVWDLVVTDIDGVSVTLSDAFTISEGKLPKVWVTIQGANVLTGGQPVIINIHYGNFGDADIYDVLLYLYLPRELSFRVDNIIIPDTGELNDPIDYYFEVGDEIVLPLWIYNIPARSTALIRLVITPPNPAIPTSWEQLFPIPIRVEVGEPPFSDQFARTGNLDLIPYLANRVFDMLIEELFGPEALSGTQTDFPKSYASNIKSHSPEEIAKSRLTFFEAVVGVIPSPGSYITGKAIGKATAYACAAAITGKTVPICVAGMITGGIMNIMQIKNSIDVIVQYSSNICPSGDDCSRLTALGFGDPHLTTFDGVNYEFQAVGEFLFTRSTIDEFEIQVRLEQLRPDLMDFSIITAVAMNVNGDKVVFEEDRASLVNEPAFRINDIAANLPEMGSEGMTLPGGGTITRAGQTIIVRWPNSGNRVDVRQGAAEGGMVVEPTIDATYLSNLEGLLGNADGVTENEFTTRNGTVLIPPLSFEELYRVFGDSWRITQEESLFGTPTFADFGIPTRIITTADLDPAEVENAKAICQENHVYDPTLLDNCVFDIVMSGDIRYAEDAAILILPQAEKQIQEWLSDDESKIQIILHADPADGHEFSFSGTGEIGDFTLYKEKENSELTYTKAFPYIPPGAYEISQKLPVDSKWLLEDIVCEPEGVASVDIQAGTAMIELTEGVVVRCIFTNQGPVVYVDDYQADIPETFALSQNYPNPFNPVTTIRYQIPEQSKVRIVLYNLLGQQVKVLFDEVLEAGSYSVEWDGSNNLGQYVASGVYIYRMQANDFLQTKKLIFLK